jgi:hypothetical protein
MESGIMQDAMATFSYKKAYDDLRGNKFCLGNFQDFRDRFDLKNNKELGRGGLGVVRKFC